MMINLATNKHDTLIVVNKVLTASRDESGGLSFHGGGSESSLPDSVDSKQIIKTFMGSHKYHSFDLFVTFACDQKLHFGTKPIKE